MPSEPSSMGSSRNPSPVSIASSTGSSSIASTRGEINNSPTTISSNGVQNVSQRYMKDSFTNRQVGNFINNFVFRPRSNRGSLNAENRTSVSDSAQTPLKKVWPHLMSRSLCTLCCTVGLFNISRFSFLSVIYGGESYCQLARNKLFQLSLPGNFLIQFLILSTVFGIPFMWFQMCLGAKIRGGIVTMFKISPICKGIGIALMITQGIIALYSNISIIWIFNYLK